MHPSAMDSAEKFARDYLCKIPLRIADVGAFDVNGSVRPIFTRPEWQYVGLDISPGPNVDVVIDRDWLNVEPESFDVVVSTSTLEHIPKPWEWIRRIAAILRPGGFLYVNAPNTWEYHEHPVDCWRIWPEGMKALFHEGGIRTIEAFADGPDTVGIGCRL